MTQKQLSMRIDTLMKNVHKDTIKEASRLAKCGAIDNSKYEDNFILPRLVLFAAIQKTMEKYLSLDRQDKKVANNLSKF